MRKAVVILNAILKSGQPWDPDYEAKRQEAKKAAKAASSSARPDRGRDGGRRGTLS